MSAAQTCWDHTRGGGNRKAGLKTQDVMEGGSTEVRNCSTMRFRLGVVKVEIGSLSFHQMDTTDGKHASTSKIKVGIVFVEEQ